MTHLILALARSGWGETVLGLRLGEQLAARGESVVFVVHPALQRLFDGTGHRVEPTAEIGDDFAARLAKIVRNHKAGSFVLADMLMAVTALERRGASALLPTFEIPIIGVDTWHFAEVGCSLDIGMRRPLAVSEHLATHPRRIVPVPFARPTVPGAAQLLPRVTPVNRDEVRKTLGLTRPSVLFCTSGWQQRTYDIDRVDRAIASVPALLEIYLGRLDVDVIHVGPKVLPWTTPRYRHVSQLDSAAFQQLVGSVDLVLSTNASATTNTAALMHDVPVLTVVNSCIAATLDAAWSWLDKAPSPKLKAWLQQALPLYRFQMWPMSWHRVLTTLLADNIYADTLHRTELLDEAGFHRTASHLINGGGGPTRAVATNQILALPSGADRLLELI